MEPTQAPTPINPTAAATLDAIEQRNTPDVLPVAPQTELDIAQGAPVPGEFDAYTAWDNLTKAKRGIVTLDPVLKDQYTKQWTTYRDTVKMNGQKLFPSITRQHYAKQRDFESRLLSGLGKLPENIAPEKRIALEKRLAAFPEEARQNELARTANFALFQQQYGQKFKPQNYNTFRDLYAKQVLGLEDTSDLAVYNEHKKRHDEQQRANTFLDDQANAILPKVMATRSTAPLKDFEKAAREQFTPAVAEAITEEMRYIARQSRMQARAVEPIATSLFNWMIWDQQRVDAIEGQEKQSKPIGSLQQATARFSALSPEQKDVVNMILREKIAGIGDNPDSFLQRLEQRFTSGAVDVMQSAVNFMRSAGAQDAAKIEQAANFLTGQRSTAMAQQAERQDQWVRDSGLLRQNARSVSQIFNKSDGWIQKSALLTTEMLPFMITATTGIGGAALTAASMAGMSYEQARLRNPEGDRNMQIGAAAVSGAGQAAIERYSTLFAFRSFGAVPAFSRTFGAKFGTESVLRLARIENRLLRATVGGALGAAATGGVEYGEEVAQEAIDRTLQDIASLPTGITDEEGNLTNMGRNFVEVLKSYDPRSEKGANLILALLPFMLIAGGGASFRSFHNGTNLQKNRAAMRSLGLPEETIDAVTKSPDIDKAAQILQGVVDVEINLMDKQAAAERASELSEYVSSIQEAWRAQGIEIINPIFDDAGNMISVDLTTPAGTSTHASIEEAQQALADYTQQEEMRMLEDGVEANATDDIIEFMTGEGQLNAFDELGTRINRKDFEGTFSELLKRNLIDSKTMKARLEAFAMQEGVSMAQAVDMAQQGTLRVKAQNFASLTERGAWRYTIDIFQGADPVNALEDFAETYWKAAINNGITQAKQLIEWVRQTEQSTGNQYLAEGYEYFTDGDNMPLWEALGAISREHALANYKHGSLPPSFRRWIENLLTIQGKAWQWFKSLMRGRDLQEAINKGEIPRSFAEMIADSVGLSESNRQTRIMKKEAAQAEAEMNDTGYKISEWAKGKLLHPVMAKQMNSPLAGELARIYDGLISYTRNHEARKVGNIGKMKEYRANVVRADNFFAPRTEKVNMDNVRGSANEVGFEFETISEMLDAIDDALFYGRDTYSTHIGMQSFSLGRVTPEQSARYMEPTQAQQSFYLGRENEFAVSANRDGGNQVPDTTQSVLNVGPLTVAEYEQIIKNFFKEPATIAGAVQQISRLLKRAGVTYEVEKSRVSQSRYILVTKETDESIEAIYKIRISDHELPDRYSQDWDSQVYVNWGSRTGQLNRYGSEHWFSAAIAGIEASGLQLSSKDSQEFSQHLQAQRETNAAIFAEQERQRKIANDLLEQERIFAENMTAWANENMLPTMEKIQRLQENLDERNEYGNVLTGSKRRDAKQELKYSWQKIESAYRKTTQAQAQQSFSLGRDVEYNLQAVIESRLARGPKERVQWLETMRNRMQSLVAKVESRAAGDLTDMERQLLGWRGGDLTPAQAERLRIEDALAAVRGIVNALPAEIRARVSVPLTRILDADSDVKTFEAFRELIQNADEVIEEELKDNYIEKISTLLDTATPTTTESRNNRTLLTPETQAAINQISNIVAMTEMELYNATVANEAEMEVLNEQLESATSDEEIAAAQDAMARNSFLANDLMTFGTISKQSSTELAQAYEKLREIYIRGRSARKIIDRENRQRIYANAAELSHAIGAPDGVTGPEYDRATSFEWKRDFKNKLKSFTLEHLNFHQFMEILFPVTATVQEWSDRAIKAMRGTTRRRIAAEKRFHDFMAKNLDARTLTQRGRILTTLSERRSRPIEISEAKMKNVKISVELAQKILRGEAANPYADDRHAMQQLRDAYRDLLAMPAKKRSRVENLTFQVVEFRKPAQAMFMSDLEMLDVLMTYAQDAYKSNLDRYGYTEEVIEKIRKEISPEALKIGEFLRAEYDAGWFEMNPTFQRLFFMDMPRILNYAPGSMETGDKKQSFAELGQAGNASAMSAGATKNRRSHMARPKTVSALTKYFAHIDQTTYWIEWAELVKEINSTLRTPDMRRAIEAKHGKEAYRDIAMWIDYLNTDGAGAANERLTMDGVVANILSTVSHRGLSWNMSVPLKQFSAALGSITMEDPKEAMKSMARIMYRWDDVKEMFASEAIQQRLERGFAPEVAQLLDATKSNPSRLMQLLNAGHLPAGYTDAAMTTISAFISYDITYRREMAMHGNETRAKNIALERMDRVIALTAQPVDTQMKSLLELRNAKGFGRILFMFKSDTRRAMAAVIYTAWKRIQGNASNTDLAKVILTQWIAYGLLGAVGTAIFKSLAQDDDDTTDYWDWEHLVLGALLGPIEGIVFFGTALSTLGRMAFGEKAFATTANPLDTILSKATNQLKSILTNPDKNFFGGGDSLDNILVVADALAAVTGALGLKEAAIMPVAVRFLDQMTTMGDKAITTPEERVERAFLELKESTAEQTKKQKVDLDDVYTRALAAEGAERDSILQEISDEKARRQIRDRIRKTESQAGMTETEKKIANMPRSQRADMIRQIRDRLPEDEREAWTIRAGLIFGIEID